jgi:hypothetical protein
VASQYTVGLRAKGKADRVVVDAEDALIAALKVKSERPEASITYVRRQNRRGDARHPAHGLSQVRIAVDDAGC